MTVPVSTVIVWSPRTAAVLSSVSTASTEHDPVVAVWTGLVSSSEDSQTCTVGVPDGRYSSGGS